MTTRTPRGHPLIHLCKRLIGDWPFQLDVPLDAADHAALFKARPAFVDYLPFVDDDPEARVIQLDDGISVAAVFRLWAADLDGHSAQRRAQFNDQLDHALRSLPQDDGDFPVIAQLYLEDREAQNIADTLIQATAPEIAQTPLSQAWFAAMREHVERMQAPEGLFPDARVSTAQGEAKGWRAIDRQIHLCLYRKSPLAARTATRRNAARRTSANRTPDTPAAALNRAITPFLSALDSLGVRHQRLDGTGLIHWLLPWLTPVVAGYDSPQDYLRHHPVPDRAQRGANWDLSRQVLHYPPMPIDDRDPDTERGVWRFGETYTQYVTLQGVDSQPEDGVLTCDVQTGGHVSACPWDRMPPGTMFTWTIIPRPAERIDAHLDHIQAQADLTHSEGAEAAREQVAVAKAARRQHQAIFNVQMGLYLRAPSRQRLHAHRLHVDNVLTLTPLRAIPARYDLLADDSFVRNLPMVYDWAHERHHARRSRLTYSSHLAAILPFYGRSTGTEHPCWVMYRRDGQVFTLNPFLNADRVRVAHSVIFGPTGSGKSATVVAQALASMAVNRPRQIFIEHGQSQSLLIDYYRAHGVTTQQILFSRGQGTTYPPYVETAQALREHRGELPPTQDEEPRSYLAEMHDLTLLMVTGGRARDLQALTSSDRALLQSALIRALEQSEAAGLPHARPQDVRDALLAMVADETMPEIQLALRQLADSLRLWTEGLRGQFFNGFGHSFDDNCDVVHIDLGLLTASGNEDLLAVAVLSLLANITALGERHQASGRHTEVWLDEGHYIAGTDLTVDGFVVGTKVWRKRHVWLMFVTQDFSDVTERARKILSQAEFWILLDMGPDEARQVARFRDLSDNEQRLLTQALKEPGRFIEGVLLSEKYPPALLRFVPPALALALGQTEGDEKAQRQALAREHGIRELDAALLMADQITAQRRLRREVHR